MQTKHSRACLGSTPPYMQTRTARCMVGEFSRTPKHMLLDDGRSLLWGHTQTQGQRSRSGSSSRSNSCVPSRGFEGIVVVESIASCVRGPSTMPQALMLNGPSTCPKLMCPSEFNQSLTRMALFKTTRARDLLKSVGPLSLGRCRGPSRPDG